MSSDERAEWETVAVYATGLEADMARGLLEAEGIPVLVRSNSAGIFGLGFQGNISGGVTLQVPGPELERAREMLSDEESTTDASDGDDGTDRGGDP